jgi:hypothetical protein
VARKKARINMCRDPGLGSKNGKEFIQIDLRNGAALEEDED